MRLIINGETRELEGIESIKDMLDSLGVDHQTVAVMVNGEIIGRADFVSRPVQDHDAIEIVRFVGGG